MNQKVNYVRKFGYLFKLYKNFLLFLTNLKWVTLLSNGVKLILLLITTVICIASFSQSATTVAPKRILLIVMDGARYDYCTPETMPNLFSFMKEGMIFKNAYAPSSWTLPSHASLFTGLYPQQHGAFKLPYKPITNIAVDAKRRYEKKINIDNISISREATTLADILRGAGYQTLGVFGNPCYGYPIFNLGKGFDTWINVVENKFKVTSANRRGFYSFDYELHGKFYTVIPNASEIASEVDTLLQVADPKKHIFLFVNFEDPIATPLYFPPHKRKAVVSEYKKYLKESMRRIDDALPPILSSFRDGLIIVTSDHGQGDGTKFKATKHGSSLHPFQTKIPLLIYNSKSKNLDANKPIDLTRIMDIILEATGLEYPGKKVLFQHDFSVAFGHLDTNPDAPIGKRVIFSTYTNQGQLILTRTPNGLVKRFDYDQINTLGISDLLQIEKNLSDMVSPFAELERVFPITKEYQKLDEKNIEMLKSLGYIK